MANGWKNEDPRIIVSVLVGLAVMIILCIRTHMSHASKRKQKQIAIEKGHIIKARCINVYDDYDSSSDNSEHFFHGTYEYTVDGKTKRYRAISQGTLPTTELDLYYKNSPHKVFSDFDGLPQNGYTLSILLGIVAGVLTLYLTGYFSNPF